MVSPTDLARVRGAEERLAEHVRRRPDLAARTAHFLAGNPSVETMETMMVEPFEKPTQIRLPRDVHERAAALVSRLAEDPELRALGRIRMSKTAVLRLAVLHGLEVLEQRVQRHAAQKGQ
jgi:hypothetical protein